MHTSNQGHKIKLSTHLMANGLRVIIKLRLLKEKSMHIHIHYFHDHNGFNCLNVQLNDIIQM